MLLSVLFDTHGDYLIHSFLHCCIFSVVAMRYWSFTPVAVNSHARTL